MQTKHSTIQEKVRIAHSKVVHSRRWIRWTLLAVIVALVTGGGFEIYHVNQVQTAAAAEPALQTAVARQGDLTLEASGTGTLMAASEVNLAFKTGGVLTKLNVAVGNQVKAGDVLAQLDDSTQQVALAQAKQALLELTSPAAIATAQKTVATDEQAVYNAQAALNNLVYQNTNTAAIQNAQANLVLASDNLAHAQKVYSSVPGDPSVDAGKANAYQLLYSAQLAYGSAEANYNLTIGHANQMLVDADTAALALAKANLVQDQTLVAALTGGTLPANPTGSGYDALQQAKLNLQTAQQNEANTTLTAPISGTVMSISNAVGETVGSGTFITIADLSKAEIQIFMDQSDWSSIKVGYVADITFDSLPNQTFTGKVTQVSPSLLSSGGNSVVEGLVQLDSAQGSNTTNPIEKLPLGVSANVDVISAQAKNAVLVPVQALHQLSSSSDGVFVVVNGTPTLKVVTVGLQSDTFAEIKSGVKAGDVVTTGIQATTK
jgi:HlyD family secretion protein